jgi:hypothetical protein
MKNNVVARLFRLCAYLVKAFWTVFFSLLVFTLLSWVFGVADIGMAIFSAVLPWLWRAGLVIGCTLAITSISEGI